jgi:ArsR family metal-binding transcriptional regulator
MINETCYEDVWRSESIAQRVLNFGIDKGESSASWYSRFTPGENPPSTEAGCVPQSSCGRCGEETSPLALSGV